MPFGFFKSILMFVVLFIMDIWQAMFGKSKKGDE